MTVLTWIAALAVAWFAASVIVALVMGRYLRRGADGLDDAFRPLATGPAPRRLADLPASDLVRSGPELPTPRTAPRVHDGQRATIGR